MSKRKTTDEGPDDPGQSYNTAAGGSSQNKKRKTAYRQLQTAEEKEEFYLQLQARIHAENIASKRRPLGTGDGDGTQDVEEIRPLGTGDGDGTQDVEEIRPLGTGVGDGTQDVEEIRPLGTGDGDGTQPMEEIDDSLLLNFSLNSETLMDMSIPSLSDSFLELVDVPRPLVDVPRPQETQYTMFGFEELLQDDMRNAQGDHQADVESEDPSEGATNDAYDAATDNENINDTYDAATDDENINDAYDAATDDDSDDDKFGPLTYQQYRQTLGLRNLPCNRYFPEKAVRHLFFQPIGHRADLSTMERSNTRIGETL